MARQLYKDPLPSSVKTYKTREGAVSRAEQLLGSTDHRYLICALPNGRFLPVAIGMDCMQDGVHFHMAVSA